MIGVRTPTDHARQRQDFRRVTDLLTEKHDESGCYICLRPPYPTDMSTQAYRRSNSAKLTYKASQDFIERARTVSMSAFSHEGYITKYSRASEERNI